MNVMIIIISSIIGYFCGSISFSRIVLRIKAPDKSMDNLKLTLSESQEEVKILIGTGANKASMILGTKWGITIGI